MGKALLAIDMPNCCKNCMCYVYGLNYNFCAITKYAILNSVTKPNDCPLVPIPEEVQLLLEQRYRSDVDG